MSNDKSLKSYGSLLNIRIYSFDESKVYSPKELLINISKGGDLAMIPQQFWTPLRVFCFKLEPGRAGAEGGEKGELYSNEMLMAEGI